MGNKKNYEPPEILEIDQRFQDVMFASEMSEPDPFGEDTPESFF